ncbi:MAG: helicase-related protein [Endomicrobiaceae bacterium]|nr:helicase-related protein [Endomicrobiaceae bacterium]
MPNNTDTKFFTNESKNSLHDRFNQTLKSAKYFDVLVGYFRTSGFHLIYKSLEQVEKIRILIGINTDYETYKLIKETEKNDLFKTQTQAKTKELVTDSIVSEYEKSEDNYNVELSVAKFKELKAKGKLEIKAFPSADIHAKVYISRYDSPLLYGSVITGSSNFTENGLKSQYEFNVELKDKSDVDFALAKFEELWKNGVDVLEDFINTINNKTWLNDEITPYELYIKFLYEYFCEDINTERDKEIDVPDNYIKLEYQLEAVRTINKIVREYKGAFISDVVGLGKTYITAMYAQTLKGKKLVIAPPPIMDNWKIAFRDFSVIKYDIESIGMLKKIVDRIEQNGNNDYDYIFVDEAHRFRNPKTEQYELLKRISINKKVILITATPLNNTFYDFKALIGLFQNLRNSDIPGLKNLEHFFSSRKEILDKLRNKKEEDKDVSNEEYIEAVKQVSKEVRDKILKFLMVRRTRTEIKTYFEKDITAQGLSFPDVQKPQQIIYEFDNTMNKIFEDTIEMIKNLTYARYTPKRYSIKEISALENTQQLNLKGFMKSRLVKRLESSKFAFTKTLERTIYSYKKFIEMYNKGTIYISKTIDVFDYIDSDNTEELDRLVDSDDIDNKKIEKISSKDFREDFLPNLTSDLQQLKDIYTAWQSITTDLKKEKFVSELKNNKIFKKKKLVIFSESAETGQDLYETLHTTYGDSVVFYSSAKSNYIKEQIKNNFDPNIKNGQDEIQILIATDVLSEGINLHRANIVINYDLPWNPTRVLQRVGRVNRVGTQHDKIFIYNIFPTSRADKELGLKNNIISKIQAFHNALGEDSKYLSDTEEITSFNLRGEHQYNLLNSQDQFEDNIENTELKYLEVIRNIRDNNTELFNKVKNLPKKVRTAKLYQNTQDNLITFFRKDKLKKFYITSGINFKSEEIAFDQAVKYFECSKEEPKKEIPQAYYEFLQINKAKFEEDSTKDIDNDRIYGHSKEVNIIKSLKALAHLNRFTSDDIDFINLLIQILQAGMIAEKILKRLNDFLKKEMQKIDDFNELKILSGIKTIVPTQYLNQYTNNKKASNYKKEIVLSEFLHKGVK